MYMPGFNHFSFPRPLETSGSDLIEEKETKEIKRYELNQLNRTNLESLINISFGGQLIKDYFNILNPGAKIYMPSTGRYEAVGIVIDINRIGYMDKLAVHPLYTNQGLGKRVLRTIFGDNPNGLFWRADIDDQRLINWYSQEADEAKKIGNWAVFFKNVQEPNRIRKSLEYLENLKPTIFINENKIAPRL